MRILIAEDDQIINLVLSSYFSKKGFNVTVGYNGQEAWNLFNESPLSYDLVITDIMMPIMDGIELTQNIKTIRPHIPVIAITAGNLADIDGWKHLFELTLNKPLELSVLYHFILDKIQT
jgi:CheY-like chemotaxis protein